MSTTTLDQPNASRIPPSRSWLRLVVAGVVVLALVGGAWLALRGLRLDDVATNLHRARALPLVFAALATLSMQVFRAVFWRLALRQGRAIAPRKLLRYTILGAASSTLLPARAGEAVRVWLLAELEGVPAVDAIGAAVAERALDVASMVLVLAPLPFLLPDAPAWITRALALLSVLGVAIVVAIAIIARRPPRGGGLLSRLGRALSPLSSAGSMVAGLLSLTFAWLADIVAVVLVGYALGMPLPPSAVLLVLLSVNLAIAVPATPAQIGSHEAGTLVALTLLHTPRAEALAFALLYHAVQVLPLLIAAMLDAPLLFRALRRRPGSVG